MKRLFSLPVLLLLGACAGTGGSWDDWNSRPVQVGAMRVTPSVDVTRTADGQTYGTACVTSRIVNLCEGH